MFLRFGTKLVSTTDIRCAEVVDCEGTPSWSFTYTDGSIVHASIPYVYESGQFEHHITSILAILNGKVEQKYTLTEADIISAFTRANGNARNAYIMLGTTGSTFYHNVKRMNIDLDRIRKDLKEAK